MDSGSEDDIDVWSEQGLTKSTKKPLPKNIKRKTEPKTKEDDLCDEVVTFLKSKRNKSVDADKLFGQNIAAGLRNITDNKSKEYVKVKIQELIFQVKFGMLPLPFSQNASHSSFPQNGPANNFQHIYHSATQHYQYQPRREIFSVGQPSPSSSFNSADNNS